jgi:hypothetical protein
MMPINTPIGFMFYNLKFDIPISDEPSDPNPFFKIIGIEAIFKQENA